MLFLTCLWERLSDLKLGEFRPNLVGGDEIKNDTGGAGNNFFKDDVRNVGACIRHEGFHLFGRFFLDLYSVLQLMASDALEQFRSEIPEFRCGLQEQVVALTVEPSDSRCGTDLGDTRNTLRAVKSRRWRGGRSGARWGTIDPDTSDTAR